MIRLTPPVAQRTSPAPISIKSMRHSRRCEEDPYSGDINFSRARIEPCVAYGAYFLKSTPIARSSLSSPSSAAAQPRTDMQNSYHNAIKTAKLPKPGSPLCLSNSGEPYIFSKTPIPGLKSPEIALLRSGRERGNFHPFGCLFGNTPFWSARSHSEIVLGRGGKIIERKLTGLTRFRVLSRAACDIYA